MWPFSQQKPILEAEILLHVEDVLFSIKTYDSNRSDKKTQFILDEPLLTLFLFYIDRVLGSVSDYKAGLLLEKITNKAREADKIIQVLSTGRHWDIVQKKIYPEPKWKFYSKQKDFMQEVESSKKALEMFSHKELSTPVFQSMAKIFINIHGALVCNTSFSFTKDVDLDAMDSVEAMLTYLTFNLPYTSYKYMFLPAIKAQLGVYEGRKPAITSLGNAPIHGLGVAVDSEKPIVLNEE